MKLKKIMKAYYQNRLDRIKAIQPKFELTERHAGRFRLAFPHYLEDIIGIGVTAIYVLQLLLPVNWFSIGRCFSIFKIGF